MEVSGDKKLFRSYAKLRWKQICTFAFLQNMSFFACFYQVDIKHHYHFMPLNSVSYNEWKWLHTVETKSLFWLGVFILEDLRKAYYSVNSQSSG